MAANGGAKRQEQADARHAAAMVWPLAPARPARRESGAEGERRVAVELSRLEAHGWRVLHDAAWPGRPHASLGHVLVGPGGIVVLDSRNWTGHVEVRSGSLRQNGHRRDREVAGVVDAAAAVAALLAPEHRTSALGALCLVGQPDLLGRTDRGIPVLGRAVLVDTLLDRPRVLDAYAVARVHRHLRRTLAGPGTAAASPAASRPAQSRRLSSGQAVLALVAVALLVLLVLLVG